MKKEKTDQKSFIPIQTGKDEMNLVEFPVTLITDKRLHGQKTIKFSDTICGENNKIVKREWIVTGSEEFGLPLSYDNDVWLALLFLGKENHLGSRRIYFTRYRLCEIMNWKQGGSGYRRIDDTLKRLTGVSIYAKNAFWDNKRKGYVTKMFGLVDDYELFDNAKPEDPKDDPHYPSFVNLNEFIYESILAGYIKNIDVRFYFDLKSVITKRLYRYLDKKRYGKKRFEINLFTLAEVHIGLSKVKYASHIKEKLTPAHKELIEKGFLKSAEYMSSADGKSEKIVYVFGERSKLMEDGPNGESDKKMAGGQSDGSLAAMAEKFLKALIDAGVTEIVARQLIKEYPIQKIENQLKTLPLRKAKDSAAVLVRSIQEDWSPPSGSPGRVEKETQKKVAKKKQQKEEQEKAERREKIENYIASLSRDELANLTQEAREIAQQEGKTLFKDKELPPYYVKAFLHSLVEKRLGL